METIQKITTQHGIILKKMTNQIKIFNTEDEFKPSRSKVTIQEK